MSHAYHGHIFMDPTHGHLTGRNTPKCSPKASPFESSNEGSEVSIPVSKPQVIPSHSEITRPRTRPADKGVSEKLKEVASELEKRPVEEAPRRSPKVSKPVSSKPASERGDKVKEEPEKRPVEEEKRPVEKGDKVKEKPEKRPVEEGDKVKEKPEKRPVEEGDKVKEKPEKRPVEEAPRRPSTPSPKASKPVSSNPASSQKSEAASVVSSRVSKAPSEVSEVSKAPSEVSEVSKGSEMIEKVSSAKSQSRQASEVSAKVSEVSAKVSDVTAKVSEVSGRDRKVSENSVSEVGKVASSKAPSERQAREVSDKAAKASEVSAKVSEVSAKVSEVSGKVSEVSDKVSEVSDKVSEVSDKAPSEEKPLSSGKKSSAAQSVVSDKPVSEEGESNKAPSEVSRVSEVSKVSDVRKESEASKVSENAPSVTERGVVPASPARSLSRKASEVSKVSEASKVSKVSETVSEVKSRHSLQRGESKGSELSKLSSKRGKSSSVKSNSEKVTETSKPIDGVLANSIVSRSSKRSISSGASRSLVGHDDGGYIRRENLPPLVKAYSDEDVILYLFRKEEEEKKDEDSPGLSKEEVLAYCDDDLALYVSRDPDAQKNEMGLNIVVQKANKETGEPTLGGSLPLCEAEKGGVSDAARKQSIVVDVGGAMNQLGDDELQLVHQGENFDVYIEPKGEASVTVEDSGDTPARMVFADQHGNKVYVVDPQKYYEDAPQELPPTTTADEVLYIPIVGADGEPVYGEDGEPMLVPAVMGADGVPVQLPGDSALLHVPIQDRSAPQDLPVPSQQPQPVSPEASPQQPHSTLPQQIPQQPHSTLPQQNPQQPHSTSPQQNPQQPHSTSPQLVPQPRSIKVPERDQLLRVYEDDETALYLGHSPQDIAGVPNVSADGVPLSPKVSYTDRDVTVFITKKPVPKILEQIEEAKEPMEHIKDTASEVSAGPTAISPGGKKGKSKAKKENKKATSGERGPSQRSDSVAEAPIVKTHVTKKFIKKESNRAPHLCVYKDEHIEVYMCRSVNDGPEESMKPIYADDEGAVFIKRFESKKPKTKKLTEPVAETPVVKATQKQKAVLPPEPEPDFPRDEALIYRKGDFDFVARVRKEEVKERSLVEVEREAMIAANMKRLREELKEEGAMIYPQWAPPDEEWWINPNGNFNEYEDLSLSEAHRAEGLELGKKLIKTWSAEKYNIYVGPKSGYKIPVVETDIEGIGISVEMREKLQEEAKQRVEQLRHRVANGETAEGTLDREMPVGKPLDVQWPVYDFPQTEHQEVPYLYTPSVYDEPIVPRATKIIPAGSVLCDRCFGKGFSKPCDICFGKGFVRSACERGAKYTFVNKCLELEDIHNRDRFIADYRKSVAQCLGIGLIRVHALAVKAGSVRIDSFIDGDDGLELAEVLKYKVNNKNSTFFDTSFAKMVCRPRKCQVVDIEEVGKPVQAPPGMKLAYADENIKLFFEENPTGFETDKRHSWTSLAKSEVPVADSLNVVVEPNQ